MRELSQVEYSLILGIQHKCYTKRRQLIELYNEGLQVDEQLNPVQGRTLPFRGTETLLYRGSLPESVEAYLDRFEQKLKSPYCGNILLHSR